MKTIENGTEWDRKRYSVSHHPCLIMPTELGNQYRNPLIKSQIKVCKLFRNLLQYSAIGLSDLFALQSVKNKKTFI